MVVVVVFSIVGIWCCSAIAAVAVVDLPFTPNRSFDPHEHPLKQALFSGLICSPLKTKIRFPVGEVHASLSGRKRLREKNKAADFPRKKKNAKNENQEMRVLSQCNKKFKSPFFQAVCNSSRPTDINTLWQTLIFALFAVRARV